MNLTDGLQLEILSYVVFPKYPVFHFCENKLMILPICYNMKLFFPSNPFAKLLTNDIFIFIYFWGTVLGFSRVAKLDIFWVNLKIEWKYPLRLSHLFITYLE